MISIYSNVKPELLLHVIIRQEDFKEGRTDISGPYEFLQCALLNMSKGKTFKPHRHVWKEGPRQIIAQESWIVLSGKVKCLLYDIDNSLLAQPVLSAGEASFTFEAGHTYEIMEDGTMVLEYKTGPYQGQHKDKVFI
jgi:cupin fold WbuC family metalloprotein